MRQTSRKTRNTILRLIVAIACLSAAWAQDTPETGQGSTTATPDQGAPADTTDQQPSTTDEGSTPSDQGAPPAATGAGEMNVENPPLSGLDNPTSEPAFGGRSYLLPGLQISESVDSNAGGSLAKTSGVSGTTRGLGFLDMQRLWKRYQLGLDYIAGGVYYNGVHTTAGQQDLYQMHSLAVDQRFPWRTGQLAIRDTFNYLPEGSFGFGSYGGAGGFNSTIGGGTGGMGAGTGLGGGLNGGTGTGQFGAGQFGSVGTQSRIDNVTIVDVVQMLSPKTGLTLAGGYDFTDYLNKPQALFNIINSQQTTGQVGLSRVLTRKDQLAVKYSFQELHFPSATTGSVQAHVWNVLYGHRVSGRLNFVVGGGPQLIVVHTPATTILGIFVIPASTRKTLSGNGHVTLGYNVSNRTHLQLQYQHFVNPGSGFLAGANSDAVRLAVNRILARRWSVSVDGGYSRNSALQNNGVSGINSHVYQFWYGGASMRRQLGQHFGAFVSYQYDRFNAASCSLAGGSTSICGQSLQRHIGMAGIDWHPHVIRLD
jgi:hypothetical protein